MSGIIEECPVKRSNYAPPTPAATNHERMQAALARDDWPLLARLCHETLRKNRRDLTAHRMLGFALHKRRQPEKAFKAFEQAVAVFPDDAELLINYANTLIEHAQNAQALPLLEKVCALRPSKAISWIKLAECCYLMTLHEKGFAAALKAADLAETVAEQTSALMQKSIHRRELGQIKQAIQDSEAAIALSPGDPGNHTNRLLFLLADPEVSAAQVAQAARAYAAVFEPPLKAQRPSFAELRGNPWRRLKVGFLSPDFRVHSVMYFVEGLLAQLDRRQFEVYAYYLYPRDDHVTERVQRHVDHFVRLAGLPWAEQAQRIRADGIDILIDLAGHTGNNALLTLAHKAAPVQVSWLGYPATTGLEAVDYKFTDEVTDPPDADAQYSERLYRLPTLFACYRPMSRQPLWRYQPRYLVRPTPALANGFITFGSCNNLGKVTDEVLALWGLILQAVPGARLLIEGKNLDKPDFCESYRQRCMHLGIAAERLDLVPLHTDNQYLTYHRIDIALDPFPLTGGTTSFDVLWMGVPMVSMEGASFKSRMGTGILTYLGRTEWLAQSPEQYIQIAHQLAADVQQLNALRLGLRTELEQSALMREDIFNHYFSEGLRTMWLQWLAQAEHPGDRDAQMEAMQRWLTQLPAEWATPEPPGVGLEPGKRVSLPDAHQRLQSLVEKAKAARPQAHTTDGRIENRQWAEVTTLAETVLSAVPHDAMALACLAEVEQAHGHTDFAVTYLRYAALSMGSA
jgi:predicted O-linked N-acetylglucosamine transferase (SPINDLY family)